MKKLFLSLAFLLPAMGMMAQTQVKTAEGILEGKDLSGIKVFKGVPFAAPPVGNLRWKAPQPVQKWEGVREAKEFGANPMQEPIFGDMNFGTKNNTRPPCCPGPRRTRCCGGTQIPAPDRCQRQCTRHTSKY